MKRLLKPFTFLADLLPGTACTPRFCIRCRRTYTRLYGAQEAAIHAHQTPVCSCGGYIVRGYTPVPDEAGELAW